MARPLRTLRQPNYPLNTLQPLFFTSNVKLTLGHCPCNISSASVAQPGPGNENLILYITMLPTLVIVPCTIPK